MWYWINMKTLIRFFAVLVCSAQLLSGQDPPAPGSVDSTFAAKGPGAFILVQPDGRLLTAAGFSISRFDSDGSYDATFALAPNLVGPYITGIALQPDGKVLVADQDRDYAEYNRLNPDGSLDSSFLGLELPPNPYYWDFWLYAFAFQPDGKLVGFGYRWYEDYWDDDGIWDPTPIYRWLPSGDLDESFTPYNPPDETTRTVAVLANKQILVAGNDVILLHTNGTIDTNFAAGPFPPESFYGVIRCLAIQPDGRILVGGYFTSVQGQARSHIARLLPDGRLDASFNPPTIEGGDWSSPAVCAVAVQTDGRILVGGMFDTLGGLPYGALGRLNADGSVDTAFNPVEGIRQEGDDDGIVTALVIQDETHALVGGSFSDTFDGDLCRIHLGQPAPRLSIHQESGGRLQLNFPYSGSYDFAVAYATNFTQPASNWTVLGSATNAGTGQYRFNDPTVPSPAQRFYQLRRLGTP